jgi:DNA primase
MNGTYDDLRAALRERVHIADLLQARGVPVRLNRRGGGTALGPFHDDHRPSLSIYRSRRDDTERFRCWSCGNRGDVSHFAFVEMLRRMWVCGRVSISARRHRGNTEAYDAG